MLSTTWRPDGSSVNAPKDVSPGAVAVFAVTPLTETRPPEYLSTVSDPPARSAAGTFSGFGTVPPVVRVSLQTCENWGAFAGVGGATGGVPAPHVAADGPQTS